MLNPKSKIYFVATVEFAVNAFLLSHLERLSNYYDLTVIVNTSDPDFLIKKGIKAKVIPLKISRNISIVPDFFCLLYLVYLFVKDRPMAVHSITPKSGLLAMAAAFFARIPLRVHTFTGQVWVNSKGIRRYFLRFIDFLIAKLAIVNIVDSPSQKDFLVKQNVLSEKNSIVFGLGSVCGVNLSRFTPSVDSFNAVRRELLIPHDAYVFIYLGRLNRDKGILDLANAFSNIKVKKAYLILVGPDEGGFVDEVTKINKDKIDQLRFIDYTREPERYLAASNVLCLPSYREGFGSVIIEAAAMGVPAIASNIYGISDAIVNNQTGLLHEPRNVKAITDAMILFLNDEQLSVQYGKAAKSRAVKSFDSKTISTYWLNFYLDHVVLSE